MLLYGQSHGTSFKLSDSSEIEFIAKYIDAFDA